VQPAIVICVSQDNSIKKGMHHEPPCARPVLFGADNSQQRVLIGGVLGLLLIWGISGWKFIALREDRQLSGRKDTKEHKGQLIALL